MKLEEILMVRTQLQLDDETYEILRIVAHNRRISMSAVVREILHNNLDCSTRTVMKSLQDFTFISSGASGQQDISEHHDEALSEDFR